MLADNLLKQAARDEKMPLFISPLLLNDKKWKLGLKMSKLKRSYIFALMTSYHVLPLSHLTLLRKGWPLPTKNQITNQINKFA